MADPVRAAGILFLDPDKQVLFLKRGPGGDYPAMWAFPGGHLEGEESLEECAKREAKEELGTYPSSALAVLTRSITLGHEIAALAAVDGGVEPGGSLPAEAPPIPPLATPAPITDFTTYLQLVKEQFAPKLSGEHVGWAWAPADQPPLPLHPGCAIALERLVMDELGVARAMSEGRLISPQRYENMTLFAMRITGTGMAYRLAADEFAWRDPSIYLNDHFVARCNGLPVIMQHPKGSLLNSKEFEDRIIGAVMLPYIKGEEVWGIARIYDDAAIKMMSENQLSTSPAVHFRDMSVNRKLTDEDGDTILIEGKPSLLDHLAVCQLGVWDKGKSAAGILNDSNEGLTNMADKEEKSEAKMDEGGNLDKLLSKLDAVCAKMDAWEDEKKKADAKMKADAEEKDEKEKMDKSKKDAMKMDGDPKDEKEEGKPKEVAADKSKKDAEKEEEDKKDSMKKDAFADAVNTLTERLAHIESKLHKPLTDADRKSFATAQSKCDNVARAFGDEAPRWMQGEDLSSYRRRLASIYKDHSPAWKPVNLDALADDAAFEVAERQIFADASAAARNPAVLADGELRMTPSTLESGHRVNEFYGRPSSWMNQFAGNKTYVTKIDPSMKGNA